MGKLALNDNAVGSTTYAILGLDDAGKVVSGTPPVLTLLSAVLERSIQKSEKLVAASVKKDVITVFHGTRAPALNIRHYVERIFKYACCSPSCFVVAYIYLDRFLRRMDVCLTSLNVHRLIATSVMVAAKYMDDVSYNNAYYAKVGGVSTAEMNRLEMKFLSGLDFRLFVSVDTFEKYCRMLEEEAASNYQIERPIPIRGMKGGWPKKQGSNRAPKIQG